MEKALERLKRAGLLSIVGIDRVSPRVLAEAITPAGYYNVKARRLKALARHVMERYEGRLERLLDPARPTAELRTELLSIDGIGPETADSLLVYGAQKPAFIADAYGRRILARVGLIPDGTSYGDARNAVQRAWTPQEPLQTTAKTWGEFHALLVQLGKEYCTKTSPKCRDCPARELCRSTMVYDGS